MICIMNEAFEITNIEIPQQADEQAYNCVAQLDNGFYVIVPAGPDGIPLRDDEGNYVSYIDHKDSVYPPVASCPPENETPVTPVVTVPAKTPDLPATGNGSEVMTAGFAGSFLLIAGALLTVAANRRRTKSYR